MRKFYEKNKLCYLPKLHWRNLHFGRNYFEPVVRTSDVNKPKINKSRTKTIKKQSILCITQMETNFTLTSGSVDGFRSTWNVEGGERDVETKGTGTETIRTTEQGTTCEEYSTSISVRILR